MGAGARVERKKGWGEKRGRKEGRGRGKQEEVKGKGIRKGIEGNLQGKRGTGCDMD